MNLSAKEKLSEYDIQSYKYWLMDHAREDTFRSLVDWVELRIQIMEEAREETEGISKRTEDRESKARDGKRFRGFSTQSSTRRCIVDTCKTDHPPWVCDAFKKLSVQKRKELISKSGRCFRCLAAGHHSRDCRRARKCTVDGCQSDQHSSYLHESNTRRIATNANQTMSPEIPAFHPRQPSAADAQTGQPGGQNTNTTRTDPTTQERSHKTSKADNVSLMVLPALINNGHKSLKVNVMLDPCSTGSYISESAAGELELQGESLDLTIAGTGGTEIKKHSRLVDLFVTSLNGEFTAPLQAHVLDNIASDTPAFQWSTTWQNGVSLTS